MAIKMSKNEELDGHTALGTTSSACFEQTAQEASVKC
jgi:hypothetical protein